MDVRSIIQDYLSKSQMMQLGTSHGNQPWVTTVYYAFDIDLNLYWLSKTTRRHSVEIEKNSKVAGTIVTFHMYGEKVRGLQFEGDARRLTDGEAEQGLNIYKSRYWVVEDRASGGEQPLDTVFQMKPKNYYLYDEINFPDNPGQTLKF